ncbi:hypothetical protein [Nocardia tengchongensis]
MIGEITAPALLPRGIGGRGFNQGHLQSPATGLDGPTRMRTISPDTATHICGLTNPELVNPEISEFLDGLHPDQPAGKPMTSQPEAANRAVWT